MYWEVAERPHFGDQIEIKSLTQNYGIGKPETKTYAILCYFAFKNDVYYSQCAEELHLFQKYYSI